jgi:hypothetical protein
LGSARTEDLAQVATPMLDAQSRKSRFNMQAVLGFLLGVVASLLCLFFSMFVGSTLGPSHSRMAPVFTGIGVAVVALVAFRNARRSSFALGAAIALGITLLLDVAYIVAIFRRT